MARINKALIGIVENIDIACVPMIPSFHECIQITNKKVVNKNNYQL